MEKAAARASRSESPATKAPDAGGSTARHRPERHLDNPIWQALALRGNGVVPSPKAKLTVGPADDVYEREADDMAERVMRMPVSPVSAGAPMVRRMCADCEEELQRQPIGDEEEEELLQPKADAGARGGGEALNSAHAALRSQGQPLDTATRAFFEPCFGRDFGDVRVHTDAAAAESAASVNARAFTVGRDVVFGAGHFQPGTGPGRTLLAHELTHVVQQSGAYPSSDGPIQRQGGAGRNLTAPRFAGNAVLEDVLDGRRRLRKGESGPHVRLIQESLVAMGYALPNSLSEANPTQLSGDFTAETEAVILQFQQDAGATSRNGIIDQDTMGQLDVHDVSHPRPLAPAKLGPVVAPGGAAGCDRHFGGVNFDLKKAEARSGGGNAHIGIEPVGGLDTLRMKGVWPTAYKPEISIAAPGDAVAATFRVGFVQNLLRLHRVARYSAGAEMHAVGPVPIKDGLPQDYHPIFLCNPRQREVEDFAAAGQTIRLSLPDVPGGAYYINLNSNPACAGVALPNQTMTRMEMLDEFRTWVVVQHRPSGCVRSLHHVDWRLDWRARVEHGRAIPERADNFVTEKNGDGSPSFVQGGPVPAQVVGDQCR